MPNDGNSSDSNRISDEERRRLNRLDAPSININTASEGIKDKSIKWLLGQETNTIMLIAILISLGYTTWWMMTAGIPAHLTTIQSGYEKIAEINTRDNSSNQKIHAETIRETRETFERTLDRIEKHVKARDEEYTSSKPRKSEKNE